MAGKLFIIDVTNVVSVPFISGIQRVTLEVAVRLIKREGQHDFHFLLLSYDVFAGAYRRVDTGLFLEGYHTKSFRAGKLSKGEIFPLSRIPERSVFFDIDSVWNNRMRRSFLLPYLKKRGVRIAVFVHDIIPVIFPQYCDRETAMRFLDYIGAHAKYADVIIGNSQNTISDMEKLLDDLHLPRPKTAVSPLGSDFKTKPKKKAEIHPLTKPLQDRKYLWAVGTIEPRKNYTFLLDFYEKKMKPAGIALAVSGRAGWNVDPLIARMQKMNRDEDGFFYFGYSDDEMMLDLYQHAFFTVLTAKYEGFGLPVVESFHYGTPVLAPDIPVFREVGGELCDYYESDNMEQLDSLIRFYEKDPQAYCIRREQLQSYKHNSWDQSEELIWEAISSSEL